MARLPYVEPAEAPAHVRRRLEGAPNLGIFRMVAHAEGVIDPWMRFGAALLRDLQLASALREIAILRVAALTPGADYEWVQHEAIGRAIGLSSAEIEGARSGAGLDGDNATVVRFTDEVVRNASPSEATFAEMYARFSEREIIELLFVIGHYMMLARIMATTQIDLDRPGELEHLTARPHLQDFPPTGRDRH